MSQITLSVSGLPNCCHAQIVSGFWGIWGSQPFPVIGEVPKEATRLAQSKPITIGILMETQIRYYWKEFEKAGWECLMKTYGGYNGTRLWLIGYHNKKYRASNCIYGDKSEKIIKEVRAARAAIALLDSVESVEAPKETSKEEPIAKAKEVKV